MTKSAAIVAIVNSALALALAFGVNIDTDLQIAIIGAVNAVLVGIAALFDPKVPFGPVQGP